MPNRHVVTAGPFLAVATAIVLAPFLASAPAEAQQPSPYVGLESREIKALSPEEIEQYHTGEGMGLALAAELNDYPGPKHVLELAAELELSEEQAGEVRAAFDSMHAEAVRLGETIVDSERRLDGMFARGQAGEQALRQALDELGRLEAELRYVHLAAHLEMRRVLTPTQVERYAAFRGYSGGGHPHDHHSHAGHEHRHPG